MYAVGKGVPQVRSSKPICGLSLAASRSSGADRKAVAWCARLRGRADDACGPERGAAPRSGVARGALEPATDEIPKGSIPRWGSSPSGELWRLCARGYRRLQRLCYHPERIWRVLQQRKFSRHLSSGQNLLRYSDDQLPSGGEDIGVYTYTKTGANSGQGIIASFDGIFVFYEIIIHQRNHWILLLIKLLREPNEE